MKRYLYILFLFLSYTAISQQKYFGNTFLRNYSYEDYQSAPQVWSVSQDARGLMYFGTSSNMLAFDGRKWRKYQVANNTVIRSIDVCQKTGKIYVGANEEFGYFLPDAKGELKYKSISAKLKKQDRGFQDIWKTHVTSHGVYFVSFTKIFRWYHDSITSISAKMRTTLSFKAGDDIYVLHAEKGLSLLQDTTFVPLANCEALLGESGYLNLIQLSENELIIESNLKGIFKYDLKKKQLQKIKTDKNIDLFLLENIAYSLVAIDENSFAIGTITGGILIVNKKGELLRIINTNRNLATNSIYSLFLDKDKNLWTGLQTGIARIDLNYPITFFDKKNGIDTYSLDVINFENQVYVATMNGIFYLPKYELQLNNDNHMLKMLSDKTLDIWAFMVYKNRLLSFGSEGIFQVSDTTAKNIFKYKGVFVGGVSPKFPNRIFVGLKSNFFSFEVDTSSKYLKLNKKQVFPEIKEEIRKIVADKNGNLWLGTDHSGIIFIRFTGKSDEYVLTKFCEKHFHDFNMPRPHVVDNEIFISTQIGMFKPIFPPEGQPDSLSKFIYAKRWTKMFTTDSTAIFSMAKVNENSYLINGGKKGLFIFKEDTTIWKSEPFARIPLLEKFVPKENGNVYIAGNNFYIYDSKLPKDYQKEYETLIRKVTTLRDSVIFFGNYTKTAKDSGTVVAYKQSQNFIPTMDYKLNSLTFEYAATFYEQDEKLIYSCILENFDESWTGFKDENKAIYTNIPEGKYTFKVKALNIYGTESHIAEYKFIILPPWHRTIWAYIAYFILAVILIWLIVILNGKRLIREKIRLENIVKERTAEIFQQKEEILAQAENLLQANEEINATSEVLSSQNKELEKAYTNVQLLSEIGQKVAANLSVETIIETVYENVNRLMDAQVFSIGIFNEFNQSLDFHGTKENGETLSYHFDKLSNQNALSIYCYKNFETILLKDFDTEITNFLPKKPVATAGELPESLIYLPLGTTDKKIGVISVQSFTKDAYSDYHLNILRNIAVYTTIALENADAYLQIKKQHNEITSSVNYASTIQNAMLPAKENMDKLFENFIFYRPKDIVSGDFYWLTEVDNFIFVAVVDCTGHGVPGAFMSMIGSRLLSEIVNDREIFETDDILEQLNADVRKALRQDQTDNADGMDVCLCRIERNNEGAEISFTGAKRPLFIHRNEKADLLRLLGSKKTVGGKYFQKLQFVQSKLSLKKGDIIYLTTDGYVDQNNSNRKNFTTSRFMRLLNEIKDNTLSEQKQVLENELNNWQKNEEQRDDISIVGLRI